MSRYVMGALLAAVVAAAGCAAVEMSQELTRQSLRMFKPRNWDYRDYNEEEGDDWSFVGDEARAVHGIQKDPDPWFKRGIMSEKARQIERNLGVD